MAMDSMKFWIITPSEAINLVTNPTPYRATTGYTAYDAGGGTAIAASDTYTRRGPKCIQVSAVGAEAGGVYFGNVGITDTLKYTFSVDVKGVDGEAMRIKIEDAGGTYTATTTFTATGDWERQEVTITAQETASDYRLYVIRDSQVAASVFYVDGFQFEQDDEATTFFSGDTEGFTDNDFYWNGTPHASTSTRSADTRAGGALLDISDYAKVITGYGLGMGNYTQVYNELVSGGALYQKHIRKPRNFSLLLTYQDSTPGGLQAKRNTIIEACTPDENTPMVIRYQGFDGTDEATQPLDIVCIPQVSHTDTPNNPLYQKDTLTFTVLDGYLKGAYTEGIELDPYDTLADADYFVMRDADGLWSVPNNGGTGLNQWVGMLYVAPDGYVYGGGFFTDAGGDLDADYFFKWDGNTITKIVGGFNAYGASFCYDASGNLYMGGAFTDAGDANGDGIVKWDGSSLSSLGTGAQGGTPAVHCMAVDPMTGYLYAGGRFTTMGGVTNTLNIARWTGSAWQAMATGLNNVVYDMEFGPDGNLYLGGGFTNADGVNGNYLCYWNGTSFNMVGTGEIGYGVSYNLEALGFDERGNLYIGGRWADIGGDTSLANVAKWTGLAWEKLSSGVNNKVLSINVLEDNSVYVGGIFSTAGELTSLGGLAVWKSGAWAIPEVKLANRYVRSVVQSRDGRLYVGGQFAGTGYSASQKVVVNSGNAPVYPNIEIVGPGELQGFSNYTTGASIQFDNLTLQAGEILTIKLDPTNLKMTSNWRGNCLRYVNAGSDLGDFYLKPGDNSITFFMPSGTSAATKAYLYYTPAFWNIEGALL